MKRPEASLPAFIFSRVVFLLKDAQDDGRQECKDETDGQKVQLPNHGTS